jgi:hypothetical protein
MLLYNLKREVPLEFGEMIRLLESVGYRSRLIFMCNSLTDLSDISSLLASLFSTPVKLSDPFFTEFLFTTSENIFAFKR